MMENYVPAHGTLAVSAESLAAMEPEAIEERYARLIARDGARYAADTATNNYCPETGRWLGRKAA